MMVAGGLYSIISFLTMEYWNQTLQYFLGARGILHSTLPRALLFEALMKRWKSFLNKNLQSLMIFVHKNQCQLFHISNGIIRLTNWITLVHLNSFRPINLFTPYLRQPKKYTLHKEYPLRCPSGQLGTWNFYLMLTIPYV